MGTRKKTHEKFLEDLKIKNPRMHEELEFLEEYKNAKTKILAKDKYGIVLISPSHILSRGLSPNIKSAVDKNAYFISKAREIYGDKYDYSNIEYKDNKTKVDIICNKHGLFSQAPSNHLFSSGCPKCGVETMILKKTLTQKQVISRIIKKYGNKYDLSKVKYKNSYTKILIGCKEYNHGYFLTTFHNLIKGNGCPKCVGHYEKQYFKNNTPLYESFYKDFELINIKCRRDLDDENILNVRCHLCNEWFTPTYISALSKKRYINGAIIGENNLYCSDECKHNCSTYGRRVNFSWQLPKSDHELAGFYDLSTLKIWAKQVKINADYSCEKCGSVENLCSHHINPKSQFPEMALEPENGVCLCHDCHMEIHKNIEGCGLNQLRKCEV